MSYRVPIFMSGKFNDLADTVSLSKIKEQSIYHPQYVLCDIPFVTYIYCYMFQPRGAIFRESS